MVTESLQSRVAALEAENKELLIAQQSGAGHTVVEAGG